MEPLTSNLMKYCFSSYVGLKKKKKNTFIVVSTFKLTFCYFKSVASDLAQNNKAKYTI